MSGGKQRPARSAIRRFKRSAYALATDLGNESPCGGRYRSTMAREPTQTLSTKVSISLVARAKRCAKGMDLSLAEFVRRCVEGRINQIEASRRR